MKSNDLKQFAVQCRQQLHQIPEIGLMEKETSKFIQETLNALNISFETVLETGIIAKISVPNATKTLAFRADMDALPIEEKSSYPHPSLYKGYMHACGHDGHMSILLGFAKFITEHKSRLKHNIVLIFQPAEEGPGGAKAIVESNVLNRYEVDEIYGLHVFPDIEQGLIGSKSGPIMAMVGEFDVHIKSKGSHGAMPHLGIDGIVVASECILGLQTVVSRNINPVHPAVLTVGKLSGGERRNIIAGNVYFEGTLRAFDKTVYELLKLRMIQYLKGIEVAYGIEIDIVVRDLYPPVINDSDLYLSFKKCFRDTLVEMEPQMISEDFSYYQERIPGLFYFLGTKNVEKGHTYPLHSPYFNFDDESLVLGIESFIKLLVERGGIEFSLPQERALNG